jgi:hypothetical protein
VASAAEWAAVASVGVWVVVWAADMVAAAADTGEIERGSAVEGDLGEARYGGRG